MSRKFSLLSSVAVAAFAALAVATPYANSNAGSKFYISATPTPDDLTRAGFEALTWIEVKGVGELGETGSQTNILTYDTWDTDVVDKAKGMTNAGDPTLEVAANLSDPGQIAMTAAALTNMKYSFKIVRNDPVTIGGQGTTIYNRGLVTGPTHPNGRNEDFDIDIFTLAMVQRELRIAPLAAGAAPVPTVVPAITGTMTVGQTLNGSTGTWTGVGIVYEYQWFADGVAIPGAVAATFLLTSAQLGKRVQLRVAASNASGSAQSWSALGAVVA